MGQLIIDHSGYSAKPGSRFGRQEFATILCEHCEAGIVIVQRGCNEFALEASDVWWDSQFAHEARATHVHKYRCRYCNKNVCHDCYDAVERTLTCPGPFRERLQGVACGDLPLTSLFPSIKPIRLEQKHEGSSQRSGGRLIVPLW